MLLKNANVLGLEVPPTLDEGIEEDMPLPGA